MTMVDKGLSLQQQLNLLMFSPDTDLLSMLEAMQEGEILVLMLNDIPYNMLFLEQEMDKWGFNQPQSAIKYKLLGFKNPVLFKEVAQKIAELRKSLPVLMILDVDLMKCGVECEFKEKDGGIQLIQALDDEGLDFESLGVMFLTQHPDVVAKAFKALAQTTVKDVEQVKRGWLSGSYLGTADGFEDPALPRLMTEHHARVFPTEES
jgi:hypothetical protein